MLTYARYTELGGDELEKDFNANISKAESYVNYYTFDRIKTPTCSVEEAIKEVVNLLIRASKELEELKIAAETASPVKAETSGSYRVEYASTPRADLFAQDRYDKLLETKIYQAIKRWLGLTGFMFRGGRL